MSRSYQETHAKYSSVCNKKRFDTRKEAKRSMKRAKLLNRNSDKYPCNTYWCEKCTAFHLTSIPKNEWRGGKKHTT